MARTPNRSVNYVSMNTTDSFRFSCYCESHPDQSLLIATDGIRMEGLGRILTSSRNTTTVLSFSFLLFLFCELFSCTSKFPLVSPLAFSSCPLPLHPRLLHCPPTFYSSGFPSAHFCLLRPTFLIVISSCGGVLADWLSCHYPSSCFYLNQRSGDWTLFKEVNHCILISLFSSPLSCISSFSPPVCLSSVR
jgi:hypothetical protein